MPGQGQPNNQAKFPFWKTVGAGLVLAVILALLGIQGHVPSFGRSHPAGSKSSGSETTHTSVTSQPSTTQQSTPQTTKSFVPVYLDTLPAISGQPDKTGLVSIGGKSYPHGLSFDVNGFIGGAYAATYAIPSGAHTFAASIGADDDQSGTATLSLHIVWSVQVDGREVWRGRSQGTTHDAGPSISVLGGSQITLSTMTTDNCCGVLVDWADPEFT